MPSSATVTAQKKAGSIGINATICLVALSASLEFFAYHPAQHIFKGVLMHIVTEGTIHQGLVISPAVLFNVRAKPFENVVINPNSDPGFSGGWRNDGTASPMRKVVFIQHIRSRHHAFLRDSVAVPHGWPVEQR